MKNLYLLLLLVVGSLIFVACGDDDGSTKPKDLTCVDPYEGTGIDLGCEMEMCNNADSTYFSVSVNGKSFDCELEAGKDPQTACSDVYADYLAEMAKECDMPDMSGM